LKMTKLFHTFLSLCLWYIFIAQIKSAVVPFDCPSDEFCKALPPKDTVDVYPRCRESEKGNMNTRKVCSVAFYVDREDNKIDMNPNSERCTPRNSDKSTKACDDMVRTYSPFSGSINGEDFTRCYSKPKPYFCVVGGKTYVACSYFGIPCKKCPSG